MALILGPARRGLMTRCISNYRSMWEFHQMNDRDGAEDSEEYEQSRLGVTTIGDHKSREQASSASRSRPDERDDGSYQPHTRTRPSDDYRRGNGDYRGFLASDRGNYGLGGSCHDRYPTLNTIQCHGAISGSSSFDSSRLASFNTEGKRSWTQTSLAAHQDHHGHEPMSRHMRLNSSVPQVPNEGLSSKANRRSRIKPRLQTSRASFQGSVLCPPVRKYCHHECHSNYSTSATYQTLVCPTCDVSVPKFCAGMHDGEQGTIVSCEGSVASKSSLPSEEVKDEDCLLEGWEVVVEQSQKIKSEPEEKDGDASVVKSVETGEMGE